MEGFKEYKFKDFNGTMAHILLHIGVFYEKGCYGFVYYFRYAIC